MTTSRLSALPLLLFAIACAGGSQSKPVRTAVSVEPLPALPPQQPIADGESSPLLSAAGLPKLPTTSAIVAGAETRRISVESRGSDVRDVIRQIADRAGVAYQIDPAVRGPVTANLTGVTVQEALDHIVRGNGFTYSLQEGVLRVGPVQLATRIFSLDYVALSRIGTATTVIQRRLSSGAVGALQAGAAPGLALGQPGAGAAGIPGGDVISAYSVADVWAEIRTSLEALVFTGRGQDPAGLAVTPLGTVGATQTGAYSRSDPDGSRLIINPMAGMITVTASPSVLADVQVFLDAYASSVQRQVIIEAKFVEVSLTRSFQFGIDWNLIAGFGRGDTLRLRLDPAAAAATGNIALLLGGGATQITAVLNALATHGDVNVLSSTRANALNNQRAIFNVTTDEIFFAVSRQPILGPTGAPIGFTTQILPQQISVGIVLDVLPQIGADNTLTMNIRPVVTSVERVESITLEDGSQARAPIVGRRESDTMARPRAGETIVIGGLMQTSRQREESGIPVLRRLPLLGRLFTRIEEVERRSELVIFITPTIVAGQPQVGGGGF